MDKFTYRHEDIGEPRLLAALEMAVVTCAYMVRLFKSHRKFSAYHIRASDNRHLERRGGTGGAPHTNCICYSSI